MVQLSRSRNSSTAGNAATQQRLDLIQNVCPDERVVYIRLNPFLPQWRQTMVAAPAAVHARKLHLENANQQGKTRPKAVHAEGLQGKKSQSNSGDHTFATECFIPFIDIISFIRFSYELFIRIIMNSYIVLIKLNENALRAALIMATYGSELRISGRRIFRTRRSIILPSRCRWHQYVASWSLRRLAAVSAAHFAFAAAALSNARPPGAGPSPWRGLCLFFPMSYCES